MKRLENLFDLTDVNAKLDSSSLLEFVLADKEIKFSGSISGVDVDLWLDSVIAVTEAMGGEVLLILKGE
jgi:hypothetical protein